jgi:type IV pilus assembly protein PilM
MAKKVVTLYIDDTSIRLLVVHGKRIKKWADLPLEPGLVKDAVVVKEAEVVAKIKQLFKAQKVKAEKVILGLSGLHCLSRPIILPQLPKVMLAEAVKREAKSVLPVPLEQLYLSWQTIPAPEGKTQVFVVAIPCNTADVLLRVLHQAGLKPYLMDIKPVLLARVVKEATAVIVDVQPTEFDIVVIANGITQPIRTVPLPSEALSWQEKLPLIKNDLDRTIKFYNSNNLENPLASSVPIFASGELSDEPELCQSLSDELGYPVLPLPSPLPTCPEGLDPNRYMVNIGLALKELPSEEATEFSVTNLNALPEPYQPKPLSLMKVFVLPSATMTLGLLVLLAVLTLGASADITSMRGQLDATNQLLQHNLSQRQEVVGDIAELEKQIAEVGASSDNITTALDSLERRFIGINGDLGETISSLPSTLSLTSINHASSTMTLNGRSPSEAEILSYLGRLDASGRFYEITFNSVRRIEDEGMDCTLTLGSLDEQNDGANGGLGVIISSLPSTLSLTSINHASSTMILNGRSTSEAEILSYLRRLDASGRFSEIIITSMKRVEDEGMDFTFTLRVGE